MKGVMYYLNKLTGKSEPQQGIEGAALVNQRDSSGNEILPAFVIGTPNVLTIGAGDTSIAVGSATAFELKGLSATSQKVAVKAGIVSDTATAATDYQFNANILLPPARFAIPDGVTHLHLTRNDAADVAMQVTLG